jgi:tetratricopeptide (TPR) repeat protein
LPRASRETRCRGPAILALLALGAASSVAIAGDAKVDLPGKNAKWIRLDALTFVIFSDASPKKASELAVRLQQFQAVLSQLGLELRSDSALPLYVYLFKGKESFEPYQLPGAVAYFVRGPFARYIAVSATPTASTSGNPAVQWANSYTFHPYSDLYHELVHDALAHNFARVPSWLNEGLAQYYSTFDVSKGAATFGRATPFAIHRLRHEPWFSLDVLLTAEVRHGQADGEEDEEITERKRVFYAQSWALVNYLLTGEPARRAAFFEYFRRIQAGDPSDQAFRDTFSIGFDELEAELRAYVQGDRIGYASVDVPEREIGQQPEARRLSQAEILFHLGDLLMERRLIDQAAAHFEYALELDPALAAAHYGIGRIEDARGEHGPAEASHRRAIELDPENYLFHVGLGLNRAALLEESNDVEVRAEATAALSRAIRMQPEAAEAYVAFGRLYLTEPQYVPGGEAALRKAWALLPDRTDIACSLSLLYLKKGDRASAQQLAGEAIRIGPRLYLNPLLQPAIRRLAHDAAETPLEKLAMQELDLLDEMGIDTPAQEQDPTGGILEFLRAVRLFDRAAQAGDPERMDEVVERVEGLPQDVDPIVELGAALLLRAIARGGAGGGGASAGGDGPEPETVPEPRR